MWPHIDESRQIGPPRPFGRQNVPASYTVLDAGPSPETSAASPTFTEILWNGRLIIAGAALLGLLAGGAAVLATKRVYRARTSLLLQGFNEQAMGSVTPVSPLSSSPTDYLQNEVKVLESDSLARRVAGQFGPDLQELIGRQSRKLSDQQILRKVEKAITVRTGMQSQVIEVFFDAPNPDLAARGANAVTGESIDISREARGQLVQDTTEWLNKQASDLKAKLDGLNGRLQAYTASNGLILSGPQGTPADERARQLQDALTRAQADRAAKEARYEAVSDNQNEITEGTGPTPLQQYQTDLANMRRQVADLKTLYQPDNYRITRLEAQIVTQEAAIRNEQAAIRQRMKDDYLAAASLERTLTRSFETQLSKVQLQTQQELQYNVLKNEVDITQKLYESVLERAKEAGAESSLRVTNIRVIDAAMPPLLPYSPNVPFDLAAGLGLGMLGGAALVLFGTGAARIRRPGELTALGVRELGAIPSAGRELADTSAALNAPEGGLVKLESLFWESFRSALISILFRAQEQDCRRSGSNPGKGRVLVIGSVEMMEGKTTLATMFGIASGQQYRRVLLIDADLRRPVLHERFGLANDRGLTDILRRADEGELPDNVAAETFAVQTGFKHLSVLTAGKSVDGSADLLYSPAFNTMLQRLACHFDLIFIDTPPLAMYPEARVLGRLSDGMVMVVRANQRSSEELQGTYQKLINDRIPVLGIVLNDWKIGRTQARAYSRYYGRYQNA